VVNEEQWMLGDADERWRVMGGSCGSRWAVVDGCRGTDKLR
jgi:hypothetical protein